MTAGKDEPQPVVLHRIILLGLRWFLGPQQRGLGVLARPGSLAAEPVDGPVARGGDDPAGRARRPSVLRPSPGRLGERVLDRVLGGVDVAEHAGQDGYRAAVLRAEDALDVRERGRGRGQLSAMSTIGRTSTGSVHATVALRAQASASSRSAAWMIQKPPTCSLPSAKGPSVTSTSPSEARSTVAVSGACRPPVNTHAPAARSSLSTASMSRMIGSSTSGGGGSPSGW